MKKVVILVLIFLLFFINKHVYASNECDESKSIVFLNDYAQKYYNEKKYEDTFLCNQVAAKKGDPFAIGNMGWHYATGYGIDIDQSIAVEWYEKGTVAKNLFSIIQLSIHLKQGLGVDKDEKRSFDLMLLAAESESDYAWTELGFHYLHGIGTVANYYKSIDWFEKAAEKNNIVAQAYLGWMIAGGRGTNTDYEKGFEWTLKAADTGNVFAQGNVGWHYLNGFGVLKNIDEATKWFTLSAEQGNEFSKNNLELLANNEITSSNDFPKPNELTSPSDENLKDNINWGNYYALIIGNNNYQHWSKLETAVNDAKVVASILEDKYNFEVELLINKNHDEMKDAIFEMRDKLEAWDNLLIYYAGHGELDTDEGRGYWIPIDADTKKRSKWINNTYILDNIKATKAKHVLLIADSCFSGSLTRGKEKISYTKEISQLVAKKTRVVITSAGGEEPAQDAGVDNHSVFAYAFIKALQNNNKISLSDDIFPEIRTYVLNNADQVPEMSVLTKVGHDGGDFIFVPQ
tara:strand:+ start:2692 stop:4242 length:1551 start_codon:yes stop_codon:yes gene_type:complete